VYSRLPLFVRFAHPWFVFETPFYVTLSMLSATTDFQHIPPRRPITYSEGYNNVLENRTITENEIIDLEGDGDIAAFHEEMERTGGGWF
jgi:hypothetical protein